MTSTQLQFIESFNALATEAHETAVSKGWWESEDANALHDIAGSGQLNQIDREILDRIAAKLRNKNDGELLSLVHSEGSEVLEG